MSSRLRIYILFVTFFVCYSCVSGHISKRSFGILFGDRPKCLGCPPRFCDDDPAIIYGYCCGCARIFDRLPIQCSPHLRCPANNYELCDQYDYMLYCCCNKK